MKSAFIFNTYLWKAELSEVWAGASEEERKGLYGLKESKDGKQSCDLCHMKRLKSREIQLLVQVPVTTVISLIHAFTLFDFTTHRHPPSETIKWKILEISHKFQIARSEQHKGISHCLAVSWPGPASTLCLASLYCIQFHPLSQDHNAYAQGSLILLNNDPKEQEQWCWQFGYASVGEKVNVLNKEKKILLRLLRFAVTFIIVYYCTYSTLLSCCSSLTVTNI